MKQIAVLVSGGGTNLQALLDAEAAGALRGGRIALVISSKDGVYALERARRAGVPTEIVPRAAYESRAAFSAALLGVLQRAGIDLVVLAGFLYVLDEHFVRAYENAIINVHPALIPSFCGDGFYGLHVHEAALAKGVKVTGATVHFVNAVTDGGPIILQRAVAVEEGDTPEILQRRVMEQAEWKLLPEAVSLFCEGRLSVEGAIVHIANEEQEI